MITVSAVSYLNTLPFIYGLQQSRLIETIDLQLDYPSSCAVKLMNGEVDLALVPIVVIPNLNNAHVISDFCIGANGAVQTVCLYSEVPINQIESIILDYQSKTSVALLKILLKEYWNLNPELKNSQVGFEHRIRGKRAALVIGDRAFALNKRYTYIYDLAAIWKEMTNLPFVFAAWIANKRLPQDFIIEFNNSLKDGLDNIDQSLEQHRESHFLCQDPKYYLSNNISYFLDDKKLKAMDLFLKKYKKISCIEDDFRS